MLFYGPQILDSSILKEFADDNFKLDENDRKFSNRVENTVTTGLFMEMSKGKTLHIPSLVLVKHNKFKNLRAVAMV